MKPTQRKDNIKPHSPMINYKTIGFTITERGPLLDEGRFEKPAIRRVTSLLEERAPNPFSYARSTNTSDVLCVLFVRKHR